MGNARQEGEGDLIITSLSLTFGPYSKDLEKDIKWLEDSNFVKIVQLMKKREYLNLQRLGQKILATFHDAFGSETEFL
jgi:hypothetical protein